MPVARQIPDVSLSAPDVPSGDVDVKVSAPDMPSADVDASVSVPDVPSVDVKAPKKGLFGKFLKKKSSKPGIDVSYRITAVAVLYVGAPRSCWSFNWLVGVVSTWPVACVSKPPDR